MTRPIVAEHDALTHITIEREMNDTEYEQYLKDKEKHGTGQADDASEPS